MRMMMTMIMGIMLTMTIIRQLVFTDLRSQSAKADQNSQNSEQQNSQHKGKTLLESTNESIHEITQRKGKNLVEIKDRNYTLQVKLPQASPIRLLKPTLFPSVPLHKTHPNKQSGFRGTGQYHYQKIEDVQSSANKKTNDGEKFYDFDDEENKGAAVASSSTLNEQKRNGKLTMVRREHLNNDSIPAAKFGKDAEATSSG